MQCSAVETFNNCSTAISNIYFTPNMCSDVHIVHYVFHGKHEIIIQKRKRKKLNNDCSECEWIAAKLSHFPNSNSVFKQF